MNRIRIPRLSLLGQMLQLELRLLERVGIEQLPQLRLAKQFAKLRLVDGQRLRTPLGERCVAVIQKIRNIAEEH